jgi:hypothetical protein
MLVCRSRLATITTTTIPGRGETDSEDYIPEGIRVSRTSCLDCRRQRSSQYLECVPSWGSKRVYPAAYCTPPPSEVSSVHIFQQLAVLIHDVRPSSALTSSSWVGSFELDVKVKWTTPIRRNELASRGWIPKHPEKYGTMNSTASAGFPNISTSMLNSTNSCIITTLPSLYHGKIEA